jgi:hypothetical protein
MTNIFCKAKNAGIITRVIRWFGILASIHDNKISVEKSKVHIICALPDGRIILNGISTLVYTSGIN